MRALVAGGPAVAMQQLVNHLRSEAWVVECVNSGDEALNSVRSQMLDAVVIGPKLPDLTCSELIRLLRAYQVDGPVLALSVGALVEPRLAALTAGADHVMVLPVDVREFSAHLRAIVRRSSGHNQQTLQVGNLSMNLNTQEVCISGKVLHLTPKEAIVVELLLRRRNTPVTKEAFLNYLYSDADNEPDPRIVDVFVCKLRRKFTIAGAPNLIETVWGRGYMVRSNAGRMHPNVASVNVSTKISLASEVA